MGVQSVRGKGADRGSVRGFEWALVWAAFYMKVGEGRVLE